MMSDGTFISSYLLFALMLIALLIVFILRLRQADFFINNNMPSFLSCALFWAAIVAFVCLGFGLLENNYKELVYPVPLAALFGAAFGALFSARRLKGQTNALIRGLVGAGLGLFIFLSLCAVLFLSPVNTGNDTYGFGMLLFVAMLLSTLVPIIIILALLTPKQCLGKNENI